MRWEVLPTPGISFCGRVTCLKGRGFPLPDLARDMSCENHCYTLGDWKSEGPRRLPRPFAVSCPDLLLDARNCVGSQFRASASVDT